MKASGVLLDTSFFIRFLNDEDPLFKNAMDYFKYFIANEMRMCISTISIAEYCVGGSVDELPLKNLIILPFNLNHAINTGEIARTVFNKRGQLQLKERNVIPNDSKLFSQADAEDNIAYYISADSRSMKIYETLKIEGKQLNFSFIDLAVPPHEYFGFLDL